MTYEKNTTDGLSTTSNTTSNRTADNTVNDKSTNNGSTNEYAYGFNSDIKVGTNDNVDNMKISRDVTDKTTTSSKNANKYDRVGTENTTIRRSGNIGNKSQQQLIEEERELLQWQLFDVIFNDLDSVLTRSKYISRRWL